MGTRKSNQLESAKSCDVKVGIIGSGISGLICAYLLRHKHEITLYESDIKPGGHVNTVKINDETGTHQIDTGFIVFNESNYPNFVRLLEHLKVESKKTRMGFSVRCADSGIEYSCLLYTSPSPRDRQKSRMPSSA